MLASREFIRKGYKMNTSMQTAALPPFKSSAGALLLGIFLGPIGLLYGSFWGGFLMIFVSLYLVSFKFFFLLSVSWLVSCVWNVGAVESYNKNLIKLLMKR
jgi:hypothetical protein